jgi:hypothetical protein
LRNIEISELCIPEFCSWKPPDHFQLWRIFLVLKAENNLESEVELNLQKRKDNLTK